MNLCVLSCIASRRRLSSWRQLYNSAFSIRVFSIYSKCILTCKYSLVLRWFDRVSFIESLKKKKKSSWYWTFFHISFKEFNRNLDSDLRWKLFYHFCSIILPDLYLFSLLVTQYNRLNCDNCKKPHAFGS